MTSPTTEADFFRGVPARSPSCNMAYTIRRCTGFSPSRTSGSARDTMTDIA